MHKENNFFLGGCIIEKHKKEANLTIVKITDNVRQQINLFLSFGVLAKILRQFKDMFSSFLDLNTQFTYLTSVISLFLFVPCWNSLLRNWNKDNMVELTFLSSWCFFLVQSDHRDGLNETQTGLIYPKYLQTGGLSQKPSRSWGDLWVQSLLPLGTTKI